MQKPVTYIQGSCSFSKMQHMFSVQRHKKAQDFIFFCLTAHFFFNSVCHSFHLGMTLSFASQENTQPHHAKFWPYHSPKHKQFGISYNHTLTGAQQVDFLPSPQLFNITSYFKDFTRSERQFSISVHFMQNSAT